VLQTIVLEYFGSFYDVELVEYINDIDSTMCTNWMRLVPAVVAMEQRDPPDQEKLKLTSSNSSTLSPLYTRLQESIKVSILPRNSGLDFTGQTGATGTAGAIGAYDGRKPITVSAKDAKLLFIYHPQVKDVLIYHEALDSFLIPYQYSRFYFLPAFFVKLNMFVALPDITQLNGRGFTLRIAVSLA